MTETKFDAKAFCAQVTALRAALESGEAALMSPEEYSHVCAAVSLLRYLEAEKVWEALETLQAALRHAELVDDSPAALVLQ